MLLVALLMTSLCVSSIRARFYMDMGKFCTSDDECLFTCNKTFTNCEMGICFCKTGQDFDGSRLCYTPSVIGEPCFDDIHCHTDHTNTECNLFSGLCDCKRDRKMKQITTKVCVGQREVGPAEQCTAGQQYYYINENEMKGTARQINAGLCGCPEGHRPDGIKCITNKIGDPCSKTSTCMGEATPNVICGASDTCQCYNSSYLPLPPDNTMCAIMDVSEIKRYGSLEEGETCHRGGEAINMLCREGLICSACPGELANAFTCNTINSDSVVFQTSLAILLLSVTSSLITMCI